MANRLLSPAFVLLWTSGYVVGALAVRLASVPALLESRFIIAAVIAVPLAVRKGRWRGAPLDRLALVGMLLQVVQFGGIYTGLASGVPAGLSALVMLGFSPLLTTGLAIGAGQERGSRRRWIGLIVGALGVFVGLIPELGSAHVGIGLVFTTGGMLGLAGGTVLQKRYTEGVDPRASVATQAVTAALVLAPVAALAPLHARLGVPLGLSMIWIGAGLGVVTVLVFIRVLTATSPSHVGALLMLVPATTALASAPALGQPIHGLTLVGMAISAAGVCTALHRGATPGRRGRRSGRLSSRRPALP